jgi:hypothetical protein
MNNQGENLTLYLNFFSKLIFINFIFIKFIAKSFISKIFTSSSNSYFKFI